MLRSLSLSLSLSIASLLPTGIAEARDIRIIGDSIFAGSGHIEQEFENITGHEITSHAVNGHRLSNIIDQYYQNRSESITTIIMDGGGNDILGSARNDCMSVNENCQNVIIDLVEGMKNLWNTMLEDGVQNVVYLGFYHPTGWSSGLSGSVDFGMDLIIDACENSEMNCILVDPREAFSARNDLVSWDGIHPTWQGSRLLAEMLNEAFLANDIEID